MAKKKTVWVEVPIVNVLEAAGRTAEEVRSSAYQEGYTQGQERVRHWLASTSLGKLCRDQRNYIMQQAGLAASEGERMAWLVQLSYIEGIQHLSYQINWHLPQEAIDGER